MGQHALADHAVGPGPAQAVEAFSQVQGERLRSIFDAAPAVIFLVDDQDRFIFVNRAWERAFGLSQEQVAGCSIFELFPEPMARAMAEQNSRLLASRAPLHGEQVVRVGDTDRTYVTSKVALAGADERPAAVCGIAIDITERKRSERRLQLVSEIASALVVRGDDVDAFMEEMCRRIAAELGADVHFHYRAERGARRLRLASHSGVDEGTVRDLDLEWLDSGAAVCGTVAASRRSWAIADVQASEDPRTRLIRELGIAAYACCPLLCNGTLYGTLSMGRRRHGAFWEEDLGLMQTLADLAAVALDRAARSRELVTVDRHRKEFLAVLGHELRGPLSAIGLSATLLRGVSGDALDRAREIIQRQVRNLSQLVEELLDGARVSYGKITLEMRAVAVDSFVAQGVEISRPEIQWRGHALSVSLPAEPVLVHGDERRLAQVVANLLANSAKYTPSGGHIGLEVRAEAAAVTLHVRDDGMGIEPELLPRVFNLFEQAKLSRVAEHGGLGIGLSLVKTLVELHKGSIEVRSPGAGQGSEFTVRLPRLPPASG